MDPLDGKEVSLEWKMESGPEIPWNLCHMSALAAKVTILMVMPVRAWM